VLGLARRSGLNHSKLLMPMAFAALMGGMLTLIGTPPNLVVSEELVANGYQPFGFLTFTPVGLAVMTAGVLYLLTIGARLLGGKDSTEEGQAGALPSMERTISDLTTAYEVQGDIILVRIMSPSTLHGVTVGESGLKPDHGLTVVGFQRTSGLRTVARTGASNTVLRSGDILLLVKDRDRALDLGELGLALLNKKDLSQALENELGVVEMMVPPRSTVLGKSIVGLAFRQTYRLSVFGIMHKGELVTEGMIDHELAMGDTLLLGGSWRRIDEMRQNRDLMVLQMPSEWRDLAPAYSKAPWALGIVGGMVALMVLNVVPAVVAVLIAALAMVLTGCLTMPAAYRAINWQSLILIAGMLPMATALEQTGGLKFMVDHLMTALGGLGPYAIMATLFLLTALFSQFISNTATTVLLAPIAIALGKELGVSPYPLVMAVAIAASAAFVTPVASPVNTLVLGPGGYKFTDFVKVGLPLVALTMIITLLVVPLILPFNAG